MEAKQWSLPGGMLIWDRTQHTAHDEVLVPFAMEELLCRQVGEGGTPIVHMWRHPRALVMGLRDSRLPQAVKAKQWLESQGYSVAVRNSGGAAVPLDLGVVNISLVMPKRQGQIDYRHDFETMYHLIKDTLQTLSPDVEKGEIKGSYCPGDYDLSIGGRKFCGIAQRRQAKAIVVQAFVVVRGDGESKAALAREFYRIAAEGADEQSFPEVDEHSMGSLEELIGLCDEQRFVDSVKQTVRERKLAAAAGEAPLQLPDEQQIAETVLMLKARYGIA
ncbi:lipoate--protein ligase family protein [Paenibacillus radicis (ex Xue et al. 2023)]|uniref:Lipoate--protein ligase family protein n=1 Tax=Paenibacillus radicis (ex Xue et al. 2023) TaxID=2972489 RepID=A0ABT1YQ70_9BACL|nr:lipoate--protein ligase family protein [Paenibacillus radicis (ex Xue et al. 2023)]MCR8634140.1 lipoate--protein ligase family protein [Paenibacillus radicis (ex Xue et al. 2023)]